MGERADGRVDAEEEGTRGRAPPVASPGSSQTSFLDDPMRAAILRGGVSNAAFAALAAESADPGDAGRITGPEPSGDIRTDGELVVEQIDEHTTEIQYGDYFVRISGGPDERYAFTIGPPIPGPPEPPTSGLIADPLISVPELEPLPQRAIRLTGTRGVHVRTEQGGATRVPSLVLHETTVALPEQVSSEPWAAADLWELCGTTQAQIRLDTSLVLIDAGGAAASEGPEAPRFAYWIDPEWTGERGEEKHVAVAAAPGVTVDLEESHPVLTALDYGRRLVLDVVRVPHPAMVPEQGTRFTADELIGYEQISPGDPGPWAVRGDDDEQRVVATTGLAGVSIEHPRTGSVLSLRPKDRAVGAAYAWQVLPPADFDGGRIRAVVGPGVEIELREPLPPWLRSEGFGPSPEPLPGAARLGSGIEAEGVRVEIVEVDDAADVPVQGTPLNLEYYERRGRSRDPDRHEWLGTSEFMTGMATTAADVAIGSIPVFGDLVDIGEFTIALMTDRDRWGQEVSTGDKVLMGIGAVIGLIPFLGGIGSALRAGAKAGMQIADAARRWGKSPEQLELVLMTVRKSVSPEDAPLVRRALRGAELDGDELALLEILVARVGSSAPLMRFRSGAAALSTLDPLAEIGASGRRALANDAYLDMLTASAKSGGGIPPQFLAPLAAEGAFTSADEASAALRQALRDRARDADSALDAAFVEDIADDAAETLINMLHETPQTRRVSVSRPAVLAEYERLANSKMRGIVSDVLAKQRATPTRKRLEELREEFAALREQVDEGTELTPAQREQALKILAEARDKSRADFNNVRDGVNGRLRKDKDLRDLEAKLRAAGDVTDDAGGGLRVRTTTDAGDIKFEPLNIEHRVRLSDNPWAYNQYENLLVTDAAQNQQFLEALRKHGGIWPTDDTERFVITHGLHDQKGDFRPGAR
ncbi:MAG: hypothetical protein ABWZ16_11750 [Microbacterium sp.]